MNGNKITFGADESTNTLDITDLKEHGLALHEAICNAVKDTQSIVIRQLPNILLMTLAQYQELDPLGDMNGAANAKQRIYMTPLNAMDVVVKNGKEMLFEVYGEEI